MSLSPEHEQQIRDYLEGCKGANIADVPQQFRRYERWLIESDARATVLLAELDRVRAELAQARSKALREAAEVADKAGAVYAARGDKDRAGAAFAVMEQLVDMAAAVVPAAGEAGR